MRFWQLGWYQVVSAKFNFHTISSYYIPKSGEKKDTNMIDHQPTSTRWCFFFQLFIFMCGEMIQFDEHSFFRCVASRPRCTTWRLDTEMGPPSRLILVAFLGDTRVIRCCWWFRNLALPIDVDHSIFLVDGVFMYLNSMRVFLLKVESKQHGHGDVCLQTVTQKILSCLSNIDFKMILELQFPPWCWNVSCFKCFTWNLLDVFCVHRKFPVFFW